MHCGSPKPKKLQVEAERKPVESTLASGAPRTRTYKIALRSGEEVVVHGKQLVTVGDLRALSEARFKTSGYLKPEYKLKTIMISISDQL